MKRIHAIAIILGILILGFFGAADLEAQESAAEYLKEARADARIDAQRLARELRMRGAFEDGLTYPVGTK